MSLARTPYGDELVEFRPEIMLTEWTQHYTLPLVFAVVIVRHQGEALYVFNSWRKEWELPAGLINPDEQPDAAARRELQEETGQIVPAVDYAGMVLLRSGKTQQLELGAAFTSTLETIQPFSINDEASQMMFWDAQRQVEGYVNDLAQMLVKLTAQKH